MGNLDRKNRLRKEVRRDDYYKNQPFRNLCGSKSTFCNINRFLEKTGLENLTEGSIAIDGNRLFGNCFTYLADGQAGDFFETHQKYLDIHLVLENEEAMAVTSPENVSVTQEYDEEKDIELYTGKWNSWFI